MQLNPLHFDITLAAFHNSWNLDRLKQMSIEEYANLSDHDSLCYWLEYGSKNLGAIGRISLNKFELWQPRNEKEFKDDRYLKSQGYAWNRNMGTTPTEAFEHIKALVVQIVENSIAGNWSAIDDIKFHAIGKWKLACLFSEKRLLPIYSMRALLAIAKGLELNMTERNRISEIQAAILSLKPIDEDTIDYSYRIYSMFAERETTPNFFIIGSKYGDGSGNDTIPVIKEFIKNGCIAIGWLDWLDFTSYMGKPKNEINQIVYDNWDEEKPALHKIQSYFRLFSQFKTGDIIAIKSHGSHNQLKIIAYAQVISKNGATYFYDPKLLGHHINVEFLDAGFVRHLEYTYAGTLHQLTPKKDGDAFSDIFGWFGIMNEVKAADEKDIIETQDIDEDPEIGGGYNPKGESHFERSAIASVLVSRVHNRIQNRFMEYLYHSYPNDVCSGEIKYIDAKRISGNLLFIYEIKPFSSAYSCIRQGIGQLFDYLHKDDSNKQKHLIIVGPNAPEKKDIDFINQVKSLLNVPFSYLSFDEKNLEAIEY